MSTIVLASGNKGKLKEFKQLFVDTGITIIPQHELAIADADETGLSFVENAIIKARNAAALSGHAAIADDSGLEVDALNKLPGIYSARFSGEDATDEKNNAKLLSELRDTPEKLRTARFQCVLVYMRHEKDPTPLIFQGDWEGRILCEPLGDNGFGYDPLFFVPEHNCSSAQLSADIKNTISHRGKAMAKLKQQLADF